MKRKILLVEDEAIIAMSTAKMMEKLDYKVETVFKGEKAVEAVREDQDISLILMDIDLGKGMDGTETAQEVLKVRELPIVFLSNHSEPEVVEKTEKITAYGYVVKNAGFFVLDASIKMAFKLFEEKQRVREHQEERKRVNEELVKVNQRLSKKNQELSEAEGLLRNKIDLIFNPKARLENVELKDVIQIENIQTILDHFYELTGMVTALLDLKGRVLVAKGWMDICTRFHRIHPQTAQNCTESDLYLSDNLKRGEFVDYKCKNGLWDVVTPLFIGDTHLGNIYTGQFFYSADERDENFFIGQAEKYGFDKDAYLKALHQVPVYKKERVHALMNYLIGFFELVSSQSYTNIALAKESLDHKHSREELQKSMNDLRITLSSIGDAVISTDMNGSIVRMNPVAESLCGWDMDIARGKKLDEVFHIINAATRQVVDSPVEKVLQKGEVVSIANHTVLISRAGHEYHISDSAAPIKDDQDRISGVVLVFRDVTEKSE